MKALILYGPGDYRVQKDWPDPVVKVGWTRVKITYAGICGSDLPRFGSKGSYRHPMVLGHEFCGTVETPAPDAKMFRGGEPVAILPIIPCGQCAGCRQYGPFHCQHYGFLGSRNDGGFAELCVVPESNLFRLPEGIDPWLGAFIEPLAVGLHVVRRSGFAGNGTALVYGAGAIGLLTALWLRGLGASRVVIADVREQSLQIARQVGFQEVIDPTQDNSASVDQFDFTFEAAGSTQALRDALRRTRARGTMTVVGRNTGETVIPLNDFERLMRKELTIQACWGYDLRGEEQLLYSALAKGWFPLTPLITHQVSLDAAPAMIQQMLDCSIFYCKVLIDLEKTT
jgi:L-iditol 2-dehydrogenase